MRVPTCLRRRAVGLNMTPMVDVVFLLIIFFLVSSHLARQESQMPLPLPAADSVSEAAEDSAPRVIINVRSDGGVLLAGRTVNAQELRRRLEFEANRSGKDLEVRIRGDRSVPYRFVEPILLAAARAGIWNVTFAVFRREDAP